MSLSDGVFAIALTLLVLSLEIPRGLERGAIGAELLAITPMLVAFLISVGVIALFWFSHHELFSLVQRVDHRLMWMNFGYLGLVVLIPFAQRLQGDYPFEPLSFVVFAIVLSMLNFVDLSMNWYVSRSGLLKTEWSPRRRRTEMMRGIAATIGFVLSAPLAFLLVNWTILIWITLIPLDGYIRRRGMAAP